MSPFWKRLLGLTLADRYRLEQILRGDDTGTFFLASVDAGAGAVILKLIPENDDQLALWERLRQLDHPHLLPLLDCGRTSADGDPFVYAAFERPDESAAAALEHTAMSAAEVRELLPAVASALRYLHENGFVHTAVSPSQIVAVGDCIKLTSEPVIPATPKQSSRNDVWDLGATLYELMTRRKLGGGEEFDLSRLPEPFPAIVQHALTGSASLEDLVQALDTPPPAPVVEPPAPPAEPIAQAPVVVPIAVPIAAPQRIAAAAQPTPPPPAPRPTRTPVPRWAYPAAGAAVLLVALLAGKRPAPEQQPIVPITSAMAPGRSPSSAAIPDRPSAPVETPHVRTPAAPPSAVEGRPFWRVVAYTYASPHDAQERARRINQQWPEFHAAVFTPRGAGHTPYMVALGGRMSRPDALRLQQRAWSRGLPRDTFIRNYSD